MTRLSANALIDHGKNSIFGMVRWTLGLGPAIKESFLNWREQVEAERLEMEEEEDLISEPIIVTPSQPIIVQPLKKNIKTEPVDEEEEDEEYEYEEEEEDEEEFYVDEEELLADEERRGVPNPVAFIAGRPSGAGRC